MLPKDRELYRIKIIPNSQENQFIDTQIIDDEQVFRIKINAQPEKGKANKELIKFLSKKLKIPKSSITILKGATTQNKLIEIKWT